MHAHFCLFRSCIHRVPQVTMQIRVARTQRYEYPQNPQGKHQLFSAYTLLKRAPKSVDYHNVLKLIHVVKKTKTKNRKLFLVLIANSYFTSKIFSREIHTTENLASYAHVIRYFSCRKYNRIVLDFIYYHLYSW